MKNFLRELDKGKIKINWNKNPIRMATFLSFLTVDVKKVTESFLGSDNGWTLHTSTGNAYRGELQIKGGILSVKNPEARFGREAVEFLDTIEYKKNLDNPYSDYVNPFYLFDVMTAEGKAFFLEYYSEDITSLLTKAKHSADFYKIEYGELSKFWSDLKEQTNE